jgi:hypothetical protein
LRSSAVRGFADVDVEEGAGGDVLGPRIAPEPAHGEHDGFVQALGLDLDRVTDPAGILKADRAHADAHGKRVSDRIRFLFSPER